MTISLDAATTLVQDIAARGLLIGDERVAATTGGSYADHNPATGRLQAEVPLAGTAEVEAAIEAARAALTVWQSMPIPDRVAILLRLADLLERDRAKPPRSTRSTTERR